MTTTMNSTAALRDDSKYVAHNMVMKFFVSKALRAVLFLKIPDILSKAGGNRPLSAAEILEQLRTKSTPGPKSFSNLSRLFRPLVREGFFTESYNSEKQPVYGLTDVSRWFVSDSEFNMTRCAEWQTHPVLLSGCYDRIHELILDENDGLPFVKAQGAPFWEFTTQVQPELGVGFANAMIGYGQVHKGLVPNDLKRCGVLDGVQTLVDVGGSRGALVAEVVAHNPHIQGVNYDMPQVLEKAPVHNGVRHVAGNFFEGVPSADAMILKLIIHDHGDEESIKILKNCFKALPKNGKVIVAEYILSKEDNTPVGIFTETLDTIMLTQLKDARERTEEEYESLLLSAGFPRSSVVRNEGSYDFIIGYKE